MSNPEHTNRLASETSPYLLQHKHNPVDWYPWSQQAFDRAKAEDKPVLLSVGYSACHWCHVMERESFEDEATAEVMNEHFVNIKVDREERPDVDHIYMQVVQAMTGQGGWPMTVFMTPEGVPIFGGTYFPPSDRHGLPGFKRVLAAVAETYASRREQVVASGAGLLDRIRNESRPRSPDTMLTKDVAQSAYQVLSRSFDDRYGGQDRAPKFPQPMTWEFLLRYWARTGAERAREMVALTLTKMARGGMYDQVGGGFHRYSVDGRWLVPHFEKMLYDNGQLARLYLDAYLAFGDGEYRRICTEILDYIAAEMTDPSGGFTSSQDADSEGEEGKFFIWTPAEIREVLGDSDEARVALAYWAVEGRPNFEEKWILHVPREPAEVADGLQMSEDGLWQALQRARSKLYAARAERVAPGRDDKVLSAWNGLACRAFAEAGRALGRADYTEIAVRNATFVLDQMRREDGRLLRTWKEGDARLLGYLEDYANTIDAQLSVYVATFDARWLDEATGLAEQMIALFWDESEGGFFDTGTDHEALIVRPRDFFDNASPCGSSAAADVLLRLAELTENRDYEKKALATLRSVAPLMTRYPGGFGRFLSALDFYLGPVVEIALVWPESSAPDAFFETVFGSYQPNQLVVGARDGEAPPSVPLLSQRPPVDGKPTAYLCRGTTCLEPVTEPEKLAAQMAGRSA